MSKFVLAVAIGAAVFLVGLLAGAGTSHASAHGGCHTRACFYRAAQKCKRHPACVARVARRRQARIAREWASHSPSWLARCVAMKESTMRRVTPGPYHSYFQWLISTWLRAGGGRFASVPENATFAEQAAVFDRYEPSHPTEWPETVPACLHGG